MGNHRHLSAYALDCLRADSVSALGLFCDSVATNGDVFEFEIKGIIFNRAQYLPSIAPSGQWRTAPLSSLSSLFVVTKSLNGA